MGDLRIAHPANKRLRFTSIFPPILPSSQTAPLYMAEGYYNPLEDSVEWQNRLPHRQQPGKLYFVTYRLADALPARLLHEHDRDRNTWLRIHPKPWEPNIELEYHRRFSSRLDRWMDEGHGSCCLANPDNAHIVGDTLNFFEGTHCHQIAWIVMPNHVHTLFELSPNHHLSALIQSWKRYSANRINAARKTRGALWQRDYFDRLIRHREHYERTIRYIRRNPAKARLSEGQFLLFESQAARGVQ